MGFVVGLVLGVGVGIGIIVLFVRSENKRAKLRADLATTVAAFSKMTVEDSRKILPGEFYPSWVTFTQRQKFSLIFLLTHLMIHVMPLNFLAFVLFTGLEILTLLLFLQLTWLNQHLTKIWPYVNEAASELIRTSVEPTLEQYRSIALSSLKFSKFTLGTVAPQFTGVAIIEDGPDNVTMELDIDWDGNPSIILDVNTRLGVALPVQVKDLGFTGVFRLIFSPLVEEFPCFGAVCYSLRHKKKLDFTLKIVGGDITSIPGIAGAIEDTIRDAIEDSILWPVRKLISILPGDYSDLELKPVGVLQVKLIQARDLTNKDMIGKSDPFAVLFVRPLPRRTKTSKTINNDLNPIWNEHYDFIVEDTSTQRLVIKIYDDEGIQASEVIGLAQVQLNELEPGKVKDIWLDLVKDLEIQRDRKYRGKVHLELLYFAFGTENGFASPFASYFSMTTLEKVLKSGQNGTEAIANEDEFTQKRKEVIVRGVLSVTVTSAENLPATDLMGKADPYVSVMLRKSDTKNKTRVVSDSLNPVWNQTFDFVVEDGLHELLILEVYDHDTFGKDYMGRCILTLTRVILDGEHKDSLPLEGTESAKLNLHLKWTSDPIYRDS